MIPFTDPTAPRIGGFAIILSQDSPKMQLSERVKEVLSPEFIEETNAWMLGFFGVTNLLKDGETLVSEMLGTITMNPRTFQQLKAAL